MSHREKRTAEGYEETRGGGSVKYNIRNKTDTDWFSNYGTIATFQPTISITAGRTHATR